MSSQSVAIPHQCQRQPFCSSKSRHPFVVALALIPSQIRDYDGVGIRAELANKQMRQVVIYLPTTSERVQQTRFSLERTSYEFDVIRLGERTTRAFLQAPGLLPFAVLSQTENRTQTLQEVAQEVAKISDR